MGCLRQAGKLNFFVNKQFPRISISNLVQDVICVPKLDSHTSPDRRTTPPIRNVGPAEKLTLLIIHAIFEVSQCTLICDINSFAQSQRIQGSCVGDP